MNQIVTLPDAVAAAPQHATEMWPVGRLKPYERNARTHSKKQIAQLSDSFKKFGQVWPILVRADGTVIAGHGRLDAAKAEGLTEVRVIVAAGWTEEQCRVFGLLDNKLALNSEWDDALLGVELAALGGLGVDLESLGFSPLELNEYLEPKSGLTDPDDVPPPPAIPVSRVGDLWLLGKHRLLCGDSTKGEDVTRVMGGALAQMIFTDPPYGVDYTGGAKKRDRLKGDELGTGIYAAALPHLRFAADDKAALYLWYADGHAAAAAAAAAGYQIVAQVIWAKNHAQFVTSAHYKGKHEPCFYAHRRGKTVRWLGPNNEVTLWEANRSSRNDWHPTQKPVELAERAIRNSSAIDDIVLDMFLGGGTTIIAAEMNGRKCFGLEIDPAYCDVIINRWQKFSGVTATLDGDGRAFDEVAAERIPKMV